MIWNLKEGETFAEIIEQKSFYVVWEGELSRLLSKHYGKPYKIQQQGDMMSNDSYFTIEVGPDMEFWIGEEYDTGNMEPEAYEAAALRRIADWQASECPEEEKNHSWGAPAEVQPNGMTFPEELWWEREGYIPYEILLWDLNRQGIIPTGEYLVEVMW